MQKKRQITFVVLGLFIVLLILLKVAMDKNNEFLGMQMLSEKEIALLKEKQEKINISMQEKLLFNGEQIAYEEASNTIYISQNPKSEWSGKFTTKEETAFLYWEYDDAILDKKQAIEEGHEFIYYYIEDSQYVEGKIVCTGLPILSCMNNTILINDAYETDGEKASQVINSRIVEKRRSTSLYEIDYRIHLLKADGETKKNVELLGMDKNDDWELHSLYADDSMIREKLAGNIWNQIIQKDKTQYYYGMQTEYVEVLVNGKYMGVYGLTEHADHKSLSLSEKDQVFEDTVPEEFQDTSYYNDTNTVNYFLYMQLLDGKKYLQSHKTIVAKNVRKQGTEESYELYDIPDKLKNILQKSDTEILTSPEMEEKDSDLISLQYQILRKSAFSDAEIVEEIKELTQTLQISGALKREQEIRDKQNVMSGIAYVQQFCESRITNLDFYYGLSTKTESTSVIENLQMTTKESQIVELPSAIPTVYLDIDESKGSIEDLALDRENRAYGTISIKVPDNYTSEYTTDIQEDYSGTLNYIRCRGQSSFLADKKSYKIELEDRVDLFGMGANKDWILLSNTYDNTMLRNKMAYWLSDAIGMRYSPKSVYVNVNMNGKDMGCYLLLEQLKVDENRLDLSEPDKTTDPMEYSYLVEIEPEGRAVREDSYMVAPYSNTYFTVKYPKNLPGDSAYHNNIALDLLQFDYLLYGQEKFDIEELESVVDIESVIDYYWIQEIFKNTDTMYASVFFYQDAGGKLSFGPEWDFDLSVGSNTAEDSNAMSYWYAQKGLYYEKLFKNKEFAERAIARYKEIRPILNQLVPSMAEEDSVLEMYQKQVEKSRLQNFKIWKMNEGEDFRVIESDDPVKTLKAEDEFIDEWFYYHIQWIDDNLDSLWIKGETENENSIMAQE